MSLCLLYSKQGICLCVQLVPGEDGEILPGPRCLILANIGLTLVYFIIRRYRSFKDKIKCYLFCTMNMSTQLTSNHQPTIRHKYKLGYRVEKKLISVELYNSYTEVFIV